MDPASSTPTPTGTSSAPAEATPTPAAETSSSKGRGQGGSRKGGRGPSSAQQKDSKTKGEKGGESSNDHGSESSKGRGGNRDRQDGNSGRKKNNQNQSNNNNSNNSQSLAPQHSRPPKTITATETVNLHPERALTVITDADVGAKAEDAEGEENSCLICTEDTVVFGLSKCNHSVCFRCILRLKALYRVERCTICKADLGIVIFTRDGAKKFEDFDLKAMAFYDRKLNIYFEDQEMYEDTMVLLRFNCPDPTCDVACPDGWNQLKSHVKKVHKLMLCDLCVRHKKVFAHEHNLMTASQLMKHFKTGDAGLDNQNSTEPSGFKGHPECGFCKESFYGDDELFEHCKQNHEQCFLCLRRNIRHQYYNKYMDLERHLHSEHYACMDPECLEKKFVVFDSDLDLKAHEAEHHPHMTHGSRSRKIDVNFSYNSASDGSSSRRGRGDRSGGRDRDRGQGGRHGREADTPSQPQLTPHQVQQIALQQQMAEEQERRLQEEAAREGLSSLSLDQSAGNRSGTQSMLRTRPPVGFGAALSEPTPVRAMTASPANSAAARVAANIQRTSSPRTYSPEVVTQSRADWPAVSAGASSSSASSSAFPRPQPVATKKSNGSVAPETLNRHAALQERVQQYLQGTSGSLSQFRTLTTQYRNSQIPANQYVASLTSLFGSDMDKTGKVVQGLYEVLDSESKKAEMMRVWHDYKTVQHQFPSLESNVTSNPTMAEMATPSARRVLVIKSSGTTRGRLGPMKPKTTSTWDRAAAAASSVHRPGSPAGSKQGSTPVFYPTPQLNSSVPWSSPQVAAEPSLAASANQQRSHTHSPAAKTPTQGTGSASWAGIPQGSSSSPAPTFRPSASSGQYGRPATSADQFPSLVSQTPVGVKPSFGLISMKKTKSQQDEGPNGWVTGWEHLSADQEGGEEESSTGKKKKNKKKILFHVG